jgi:four helix bundle protein
MLRLNHKNLDVWKLSIDLVTQIYKLTEGFPKYEQFGLTSQIRRAVVSISSNLAEGSSRKSVFERKRFFEISRLSLVETDTQLEIATQLCYVSSEQLAGIGKILNELFAKITKLILNTK